MVLAKDQYGLRERHEGELKGAEFVEFTAQTRMSGVDLADGRQVRKGAVRLGLPVDPGRRRHSRRPSSGQIVDGISSVGGTPLVVAEKANGTAPRARA